MTRSVVASVLLLGILALGYGFNVTRRDRNYHHYLATGEAALARGDAPAAVEAFSMAIALRNDSMVAYLRRGEAYRRAEELDAALRDLRTAAELDPLATRPRELLGDVNLALLRYARAAQRYQEYLDLDEQSPRVLYKLALARYRGLQASAAVPALKRAVELQERFPEAYYLLGLCLRDTQQTAEALAALEQAFALAPAMLQVREELADLYGRLGRPDDQLAQLEALLALDPIASRAVTLGLTYAQLGDPARAIQTLGRAARRYPAYRYTYVALGRVWLETAQAQQDQGALNKALEALQSAVGVQETSETLMLFGRALLLAGDLEPAERTLQRATEMRPVDPLAFYYLAEAAEQLGHDAIAQAALFDYHALSAEGLDPGRHAELAARLGDLSLRLEQPAAAATWFGRASAAAPHNPALLVRLADAQWQAGKTEKARATLAHIFETFPANAEAKALARRFK